MIPLPPVSVARLLRQRALTVLSHAAAIGLVLFSTVGLGALLIAIS